MHRIIRHWLTALPLACVAALHAPAAAAEDAKRGLAIANKTWQGDFGRMTERRMIRVAVPFGRTLYFNDNGEERGITAGMVRDFEAWINKKYRKDRRPITIYLIPTTRDRLLADVAAGLADISAGNITITESRKRLVDFVPVNQSQPGKEIVVTGPGSPPLQTLDDLSGKTVHVRPSTSFHESLVLLNLRLKAAGKAPVKLAPLPDALEDEDKLEMLNAGLLEIVVMDDWKAQIWASVLPKITLRPDLVLRDDVVTGWAIRKDSPELHAAIEDYFTNHVIKQGVLAYRIAQYQKNIKQISNPAASAAFKRFEAMAAIFQQYGERYRFDPLMLAAQGYQESRLNQNAKSHVGAIGVMQLMPATGSELGVGDIAQIEPNIHAGAKYLDQLMSRYFKDANFSEENRPLFAFAAYNAGPGRMASIRKEAAKRGLNPDKWFNNVEIVTAEKVGAETTTYVRNIYKYYVAYKLTRDAAAARQKAREQFAAPAA
jgi:membrane-bound lytic murein transglycosylase MltF